MAPHEFPAVVTDRHARMSRATVPRVLRPRSEAELMEAVGDANRRGQPLSVGGRLHAMGGHQFKDDVALLDLSEMRGPIELDGERGLVRASAGICWPELVHALVEAQAGLPLAKQWGIRQKQTGANDLTLGGAVSANAHGRGLKMRPFIGDVEALRVVNAEGQAHACSREESAELFRHAVGGYGLFGLITEVNLRLSRRRVVRRVVREAHAAELMARFNQRIDEGYLYGDFQFDIDPGGDGFLSRGVFSCYEPLDDATPIPDGQRYFTESAWLELVRLARAEKPRAYDAYLEHYRATDGQIYHSDTHQLSTYTPGYADLVNPLLPPHLRGSEMITELYVARDRLAGFLGAAADLLRSRSAPVTYGTVRLVEPDGETALPWARPYRSGPVQPMEGPACVIFNLLINEETEAARAADFRALIDLALDHGDGTTPGSFFLTYHRYATPSQLLSAYPEIHDWNDATRRIGWGNRIESQWADWIRSTV